MKFKIVLCSVVLSALCYQLTANSNPGKKQFRLPDGITAADMVPGTIILKLKPEFRNASLLHSIENQKLTDALNAIGATLIAKKFPGKSAPATERNAYGVKMVDLSLIYQVRYSSQEPIEKVVNSILNTGIVEYAEPKYLPRLTFTPNDPNTGLQYFLGKIQAYAAWDLEQGDTSVVIGITDTGSDLDHPDLEPNLKY